MMKQLIIVSALVAMATAAITDLTTNDKKNILAIHNTYRQAQGAAVMPTLTWSDALEKEAQSWTDNCQFKHQPGQPWGENIAAKYARNIDNTAAIDYMIRLWIAEEKENTGGDFTCCNRNNHKCCHLTQVVWAKTTKIGCGMTFCPTLTTSSGSMSTSAFLACYYDPPGNYPVRVCTSGSSCSYDWSPYVKA